MQILDDEQHGFRQARAKHETLGRVQRPLPAPKWLELLLLRVVHKGGHISIGLGDYGYAELGKPSNADLVKKVADIARAVGREVATPAQARDMLAVK